MEDYIAVNLSPNDDLKEIPELREQAFVGVFDGHGGKEAAKYAREALWQEIQKQPKFRSQDVDSVSEAIKDAYLALHNEMVSYRRKCMHYLKLTLHDRTYSQVPLRVRILHCSLIVVLWLSFVSSFSFMETQQDWGPEYSRHHGVHCNFSQRSHICRQLRRLYSSHGCSQPSIWPVW